MYNTYTHMHIHTNIYVCFLRFGFVLWYIGCCGMLWGHTGDELGFRRGFACFFGLRLRFTGQVFDFR